MCASGTASGRRGAALVIVMLVMAVLLLAGTTFLTISSTESQIALNERASMQAFQLAEGGLQAAIAVLDLGASYTGDSGAIAAGGGQTVRFVVSDTTSICPSGLAKQVVATGTVAVPGGQAQAQVLAVVDRISYPFRWAAFATVPNTLVTDSRVEQELWLDDGARIASYDSTAGVYDATSNSGRAGHLGANGDVTLDPGVDVLGNVRVGDVLHAAGDVEISGATAEGLSPAADSPGEQFPSVTPPTTPTMSCSVGSWSTVSIGSGTHTFYCTSFSMGNGAKLLLASGASVTIYVTGTVSLGDGVTLGSHPPTQLRIITKSDGSWSYPSTFSAGSNLQFSGLLYGRNTNITLGSGATVHGSIIGRTVYLGLNGDIRRDVAATNLELCHGGKYTVRRGTWREVLQ